MVTHSRPLAEAVADHLVEIEGGRLVDPASTTKREE
jgi:hypothetical protein